jgi:hypothetical protein
MKIISNIYLILSIIYGYINISKSGILEQYDKSKYKNMICNQ